MDDKYDPRFTQRDPSNPYNRLNPQSMRNSGSELDGCCDGDLSKAVGEMPKGENQ
jgi:hypothetical protein